MGKELQQKLSLKDLIAQANKETREYNAEKRKYPSEAVRLFYLGYRAEYLICHGRSY